MTGVKNARDLDDNGRRKLVVIGLDCATPDILFTDFLDELPNLARVFRSGVWGTVRSTDPPITVPAWTVMTSSKNPGRHGFFGFRNRKRGSYEDGFIATGNHVRAKRVWDYLSEAGYKVSVHAVPQTFPAYPVNGVMTACFLTPDTNHPGFCHPPGVKAELDEIVPDYAIDVRDFRTEDKDKLLREIYKCCDDHFDAAEHFVTAREWDFFMMVEMGVDRIHHGMWQFHDPKHFLYPGDDNPYRNAILDYYRHVDARVGRLLERVPEDTVVMVVSDHGAKRMDGAVNINDWLRDEGYLVMKEEPSGPTKFREGDVDWPRTRAWAFGGYHARLFVNLKGREPEGVVEPHEYDALLDEIAEKLGRLRDPDGKPIAGTRAARPEDEYGHLPDVDLSAAPDLHLYIGDMHWRASQSVGNPDIWSFEAEVGPDGATHAWDGVFGIHDPLHPIAGGKRVEGLHIMDVCPTVLRIFGIAPPDDLEGEAVPHFPYPDEPPATSAVRSSSRRDMTKLGDLGGRRVAGPSAHRGLQDAASRTSGIRDAMGKAARRPPI